MFWHKTLHQVQFIFNLWTSGIWHNVVWCSYQRFWRTYWRWSQKIPLQAGYLPGRLYGGISKKYHENLKSHNSFCFNFKTVTLNPKLEWNAVGPVIWTHHIPAWPTTVISKVYNYSYKSHKIQKWVWVHLYQGTPHSKNFSSPHDDGNRQISRMLWFLIKELYTLGMSVAIYDNTME